MHPRITELVNYLETQRAAVLGAAHAVPAARWPETPTGGGWSVSEVLDHLHRVESGVARLIAKRAGAARAAGHAAETGTSSMLGALAGRGVEDRNLRIEAPAQVAPAPAVDADRGVAALGESRASLLDAIGVADGLALGDIHHTHLVLGEINLYQWILFVGLHEKRHQSQLVEIPGRLDAVPR